MRGEVAALRQPFLLLKQLSAHQAHNRSVVGKNVGKPVDNLFGRCAPDLAPFLLREVKVRMHIVKSGLNKWHRGAKVI